VGAGGDAGAPASCDPKAPFAAPVLVEGINTPQNESVAQLTADELAIYFTRFTVASDDGEIFMATRPTRSAPFGDPVPVGAISSNGGEAHASVAPDRRAVYFARFDGTSWNLLVSRRADLGAELGIPQIFLANSAQHEIFPYARPDEVWLSVQNLTGDTFTRVARAPLDGGAPVVVDGLQMPGFSDYAPVLSADGRTLFFSSLRPGGPPKATEDADDIFVTHRLSDGDAPFEVPALVAELSTPYRELAAWLSPDDCRLYFGSNRLSSFDIFVAERQR
jgi:hypothetical protein